MISNVSYKGYFTVEHVRNGVVIAKERFSNLVTNEGVANLFDAGFGGATAVDPWYIGLINNSPTPTILTSDTLAAHSGWTEFTSYSGTRQTWIDTATASRVKVTTSVAVFDISATASIYGLFLASVTSGTSGVIWSEGAFDVVKPVVSSDTLNATYEIELA